MVKLARSSTGGFEKYRAGQLRRSHLVWNPIHKGHGPREGYRPLFQPRARSDQITTTLRAFVTTEGLPRRGERA